MLSRKQLFSLTTIFFIIISGCSPSTVVDSTTTATLSIATETPEPSSSPTLIPSATVSPTVTPIPINVRESLELAQEIAPEAESIAFGYDDVAYALNATGNVIAIFNPETKKWEKLPFSKDDLVKFTKARSYGSNEIILQNIRVGRVFYLGLPEKGAIEIGNGYHILQMFEAFWLDDNGNMQMALVPSITQSNDGTIVYGMVAFENLANGNKSFEQLKVLAAESNYHLLPSAAEQGYTPPSEDYNIKADAVKVELSSGDNVSIGFPRTGFVSDGNRKEMLRIIKASLPHFVQLLNDFSETGSLEEIKALDPSKVPILPAIGVQIDEDVRKP